MKNYGQLDRAYGNHHAGQTCPFFIRKGILHSDTKGNLIGSRPRSHISEALARLHRILLLHL